MVAVPAFTKPPSRRLRLATAIAISALATLAPLAASIYAAHLDAVRMEKEHLQQFADRAVLRLDLVLSQATAAIGDIEKASGAKCSPDFLTQLRGINLEYRYVLDAGLMANGAYLCTSLLGDARAQHLPLPGPDWQTREGYQVWLRQKHPLQVHRDTIMVGRNGAYVSIDPESLVDVVDPARRQLAVVNVDRNAVLAHTRDTTSAEMLKAWTHAERMASDNWLYVTARSKRASFGVVVKAARTSLLSGWISLLGPWLAAGFLCSAGVGWLAFRQMSRQLSLRGSLEWAIRRRELEVHYQPIVELSTRKCIGVEALVRWRQDGHSIGPDIFIPLAEEHGLIQPLTDLVLEKTLHDLAAHLRAHPSFYVTLNLSDVDLRTDRFLRLLTSRLENIGIAPSQLRIEATERSFMDAEACRSTVDAFRRAGHSVYIDDFGTGYSSLSYLQDFSIDALKIDKSFVDAVGRDAASSPVALHIIRMAHDLGLNVVAEGIEHESQARYLAGHNVKYGQGWLFAKAMPIDDLLAYMQREGSGKEPAEGRRTGELFAGVRMGTA